MSDRPPPGRAAPPDPVAAGTRLAAPPYVPEVRLRLADEVFGLWGRTGELPYWAFAWPGGLALARHVLDHPAVVAGRRVLDLAAGSGLVGIAAARAGAASVLAVDVDPLAGAAIAANAAANGVAVSVLLADLLDAPAAGPAEAEAAEVVLAGDVFYERPLARRVLGLPRARAAARSRGARRRSRPRLPAAGPVRPGRGAPGARLRAARGRRHGPGHRLEPALTPPWPRRVTASA